MDSSGFCNVSANDKMAEAPYPALRILGGSAGDGLQRGLQHREGVCEQPEDGLG